MEGEDGDRTASPVSRARAMRILADRERRVLILHLTDTAEETVPLPVCRRAVADAVGHGEDVIGLRMHHVHLPMLADAGVLDYDERSETIRYYGDARLEGFLDRIDE